MLAAKQASPSSARVGKGALAPKQVLTVTRPNVACRAHSTGAPEEASPAMTKRQVVMGLASLAAVTTLAPVLPSKAEGEEVAEFQTFVGYATPPTSYGGYGGNAEETPKYTFEYPTGWKKEAPNKVEKGTQGIDGRVVNPKSKDQRAFLITLARAGEDNASFKLMDLDSTFAGFAGADYNLQDALTNANEIKTSSSEKNGISFYNYDIDSPDFRYLASISVKDGKVFALFVRSPARAFKSSESKLRHIIDTFTLL